MSLFPQLNLSGNATKDTPQVYSYGDSKSLLQNLSKKINWLTYILVHINEPHVGQNLLPLDPIIHLSN